MRNIFVFIIILVTVSAAIFGIFHFIFPQTSEMMGWCVASGILMTLALDVNILLVSSHKTLNVKNAATSWCVNVTAICFFVWTIFFVFVLGDYQMAERNLNWLYIGYLIILIVGLSIFFLADRGGSIAQTHNDAVQNLLQSRENYVAQLSQLRLNAIQTLNSDPKGEIAIAISRNIDLLRNAPASLFNSQTVCNQLSQAIMPIDEAIEGQDSGKLIQANYQLSLILKSIRL